MTKTTKKILIGVGGFLVAVYLYSLLNKKLRKPSQEQLSLLDENLLLKKGSRGAEVVELQRILKDEMGYNLGTFGTEGDGIDGDFGTMTENALFKAKGVKEITLKEIKL
jgi:peptidoglycan hydrolase-like protein with peptidoglycan-binding domain